MGLPPPPGTVPTRCGARPEANQSRLSRTQRLADGFCCQSSYPGVGAQTGSSDPSSANKPAAYAVSTTNAACAGATSRIEVRRLKSRTERSEEHTSELQSHVNIV